MVYAFFEKYGKKYAFYLENNQMSYGYLDDKDTKLSDDEIKMMEEILPQITLSMDNCDHIKCGKIKFHNKSFQIMLDKRSKLKFFYEIKNNTLAIPEQEDLEGLNAFYNSEDIIYNNLLTKKQKKNFRRNVKILLGELVLITMATGFLVGYTASRKNNISQGISKEAIVYSMDYIKQYLNDNPNLTDVEKEFLAGNEKLFEENKQYINMAALKEFLPKFSITYVKENGSFARADFNTGDKSIRVYGHEKFDNGVKELLMHEFLHGLSGVSNNYGLSIMEAMTVTLSKEYFDGYFETHDVYDKECKSLFALCEIIGPEVIIKSYFSGSVEEIQKSLTSLDNNEDNAIRLIGLLDNTLVNRKLLYYEKDSKTFNEIKESDENNDQEIYNLLGYYFNLKYGYSMEEDQIMMAYLNEKDNIINLNSKGYFTNSYVENHKNVTYQECREEPMDAKIPILIYDNVELNDQNRKISIEKGR